MRQFVPFYLKIWTDAAQAVGATVTEMQAGLWRINYGDFSTLIDNYIVQIDDPVTLNVAGDKPLCHRILMESQLPVPDHEIYTLAEFHKVEAFARRHPRALFVVKPAAGTSGARGVTTHLKTVSECRSASVLASLYGKRILIETWIPGESYRLLFLDGLMIHASRRRGLRVTGDGTSTIAQLVDAKIRHAAVQSQRDVAGTLRAQGLTVHDVLEAGRTVLAMSVDTMSTGNSEMRTVFNEDATEDIGAELQEQAACAVRALGSSFAGVDVIALDAGVPLNVSGGVINEINTTPGLHHHYGLTGRCHTPDPATRVLARLLRINVVDNELRLTAGLK
jgi:cyanophycin synthetase